MRCPFIGTFYEGDLVFPGAITFAWLTQPLVAVDVQQADEGSWTLMKSQGSSSLVSPEKISIDYRPIAKEVSVRSASRGLRRYITIGEAGYVVYTDRYTLTGDEEDPVETVGLELRANFVQGTASATLTWKQESSAGVSQIIARALRMNPGYRQLVEEDDAPPEMLASRRSHNRAILRELPLAVLTRYSIDVNEPLSREQEAQLRMDYLPNGDQPEKTLLNKVAVVYVGDQKSTTLQAVWQTRKDADQLPQAAVQMLKGYFGELPPGFEHASGGQVVSYTYDEDSVGMENAENFHHAWEMLRLYHAAVTAAVPNLQKTHRLFDDHRQKHPVKETDVFHDTICLEPAP